MNQHSVNNLIHVAKQIAASMNPRQTFRHVSIVISGKSIVAIGTNSGKTHTLAREMGYMTDEVHSELDAFSKIRYKNGRFTLVNFRFNKSGNLRCSKPCKYCLPWTSIFFDETWYSTNKGMTRL